MQGTFPPRLLIKILILNFNELDTFFSEPLYLTSKEIDKKIQFHLEQGRIAFTKANKLCVLVPEEKRKIAYDLFEAAIQASVGMKYAGYPGLLASLICSLAQYGIFVCEQCYQIKEALDDSEYHYNMLIYYLHKQDDLRK